MKGKAIKSMNMFSYNGWYLAKFVGTEAVTSIPGKEFTVAKFKIENSNSEFPESFYLTNDQDEPIVDAINEVLVSVNIEPIAEGADVTTIMSKLQQCENKMFAVLMLPKTNKKGKTFHRLSFIPGERSILPAGDAGKKYEGTVETKKNEEAPKKQNEVPF